MSAVRAARVAALVALALAAAAGAAPAPEAVTTRWRPPVAEPSKSAWRVLDSLPDPSRVRLPADIRSAPMRAPVGGAIPGADSVPGLGAAPGACYEVQLAASADPATAQQMADAAAVRLGLSTRVLTAGGLHRVRAGGCLDGTAATRLRDRARAAGYLGAFLTPAR